MDAFSTSNIGLQDLQGTLRFTEYERIAQRFQGNVGLADRYTRYVDHVLKNRPLSSIIGLLANRNYKVAMMNKILFRDEQ